MASSDKDLVKTRGFPAIPSEKLSGHDATVVEVGVGQTVTADNGKEEIFVVHAHRADVMNFAREGNDLVVEFVNAQKLVIRDFFGGAVSDKLVFVDGQQPVWVDFSQALTGVGDGIAESLVHWFVPVAQGADSSMALLGLLGLVGAGTVAAAIANEPDGGDGAPPKASTQPAAPGFTVTDNVGPVRGPIANGGLTDDNQPTFSGTGVAGNTVKVTDGSGNVIGTTTVGQDGTWSLRPFNPVADGAITFHVTQVDPDGNESTAADITLMVDTEPPAQPGAPDGYKDNEGPVQSDRSTASTTDDPTPGIHVGTGLIDKPTLYVDGDKVEAVYDPETGTLTPVNPLPEGNHEITYTLTDEAGNESDPSEPIVLTVDTTAPPQPGAPDGYKDNEGPVQDDHSTAPTTDDPTPGIQVGPGLTDTPTLYVDGDKVEA
ncbi:MAG: Ig-like domain-containing protein, partial [Azoarcus sp.]|nr:Ig-like domain-containing protein [Azoarcus sp.]